MNWHSPAEFLAMGGYGIYVWGSLLACLLAVISELIGLRQRRRQVLRMLRTERDAWPESAP